ncbi:hypothetical protein ACNFH8_03005 [Pseudomonas sp. NY15436]|uniref:hypothetical protein n=1 Tax=Pseudomonas sp. NY15436 TaxID=3400359 RepID=UPI003A8655B2
MHLRKIGVLTAAILLTGCGDKSDKHAEQAAEPKTGVMAQIEAMNAKTAAERATRGEQKQESDAPTFQSLPAPPQLIDESEYTKIENGSQLLYLYNAHSDQPADVQAFIDSFGSSLFIPNSGSLSGDKSIDSLLRQYGNTHDKFRQKDIAQQIEPLIKANYENYKKVRYVKIDLPENNGYSLKSYDFDKKAFPFDYSPFNAYHYVTQDERKKAIMGGTMPERRGWIGWSNNRNYHLNFNNGMQFKYLSVENEEKARQLESYIAENKPLTITVYGYLDSLQNGYNSKKDGSRIAVIKINRLIITSGKDSNNILLSLNSEH